MVHSPKYRVQPSTSQHPLKMDRNRLSVESVCSMLPALALVRAALHTKSAIYRLLTVRAEPAAEHTVCWLLLQSCVPHVMFFGFCPNSDDTKEDRQTR